VNDGDSEAVCSRQPGAQTIFWNFSSLPLFAHERMLRTQQNRGPAGGKDLE